MWRSDRGAAQRGTVVSNNASERTDGAAGIEKRKRAGYTRAVSEDTLQAGISCGEVGLHMDRAVNEHKTMLVSTQLPEFWDLIT